MQLKSVQYGAGYNPLIAGDDDGLVGVNEAQVEGMQVFKRIKGLHTFVMNAPETIDVILEFLKTGRGIGDKL